MITIDARELYVSIDELIEYLKANIITRGNPSNIEILLSIEQAHAIYQVIPPSEIDGALVNNFMGARIRVRPIESDTKFLSTAEILPRPDTAWRIVTDEMETTKKVRKKKVEQPKPRRHVPVWED